MTPTDPAPEATKECPACGSREPNHDQFHSTPPAAGEAETILDSSDMIGMPEEFARKPDSKKVEAAKGEPVACAKCGSTDIYTKFRAKGSPVEEFDLERPSCWLRGTLISPSKDSFGSDLWKRDLLTRHCRGCQFDWITDTLDTPASPGGDVGEALLRLACRSMPHFTGDDAAPTIEPVAYGKWLDECVEKAIAKARAALKRAEGRSCDEPRV